MLSNTTYNLIETASVISKGLHRYEKFQADAKDCPGCKQLWSHMKQADEEQLRRLLPHLKEHMDKEQQTQHRAA